MTAPGGSDERAPRFTESMPRALFVLFAIAAVAAVAASIWLVLRPPASERVPLGERRPPPGGGRTHDAGRAFPLPAPSPQPSLPPACPAVADVTVRGFAGAVRRLGEALRYACTLSDRGVDPLLPRAVAGLRGATVRFANFERSGLESASEPADRTLLLNSKLSSAKMPVTHVVPVLLHEAFHLAAAGTPSAADELRARRVERAACRELIRPGEWPRWCRDADQIVRMAESRALALLRDAGYR